MRALGERNVVARRVVRREYGLHVLCLRPRRVHAALLRRFGLRGLELPRHLFGDLGRPPSRVRTMIRRAGDWSEALTERIVLSLDSGASAAGEAGLTGNTS